MLYTVHLQDGGTQLGIFVEQSIIAIPWWAFSVNDKYLLC